jgi:hypothetical protein
VPALAAHQCFPASRRFFRIEESTKVMGKPAHQKRGKPRPRPLPRRSARIELEDVETRASLRRWVNLSRRDLPQRRPDLT